SVSNQFTDPYGSYDGQAYVSYGINKLFASSLANNSGINVGTEWMVVYTLTGAPVGTPVNLLIELGYELSLGTNGTGSAGFRMVLNNDFFGPFDIATTGNPFGNDNCFDRPGQTVIGACSGDHAGTVSRWITATVGPNNRLSLSVSAST